MTPSKPITWFLKMMLAYDAIIAALAICFATGLISGWGYWYSPGGGPYRLQTDALLRGHFALSPSPADLDHDLAWANGGVQQVWGLGDPLWRLPFEALARVFGQQAFPDRLCIAAAWAIVIYLLLRAFAFPSPTNTGTPTPPINRLARLAQVFLIAAFPPILTLSRGVFRVYEEAALYTYLAGIGLYAGLAIVVRHPKLLPYLALTFFAGLIGFFRPTLEVYGVAAVLLACWATRRAGWAWWKSLTGFVMFGFGGFLLFLSNWQRFGSGFEFGHNINMTLLDLIYSSRFGYPFASEPFWPALKELFGMLFSVQRAAFIDYYASDVVAWQSPTPRWREFYETTFDFSILALIILGGAAVLYWVFRTARKKQGRGDGSGLPLAAVWFAVASIPLFFFYLRFHAVACRYLLDFAPAFAALAAEGMVFTWTFLAGEKKFVQFFLAGVFVSWFFVDVLSAEFAPRGQVADQDRLLRQHRPIGAKPIPSLPDHYARGLVNSGTMGYNGLDGIYMNGGGWNPARTQYAVVVFFDSPQKRVVDVAPVSSTPRPDMDYSIIHARIGLEAVTLESITPIEGGKRLVFSGPKRETDRHGIQPVFLSFMRPADFPFKFSDFRLLEVSCRETP